MNADPKWTDLTEDDPDCASYADAFPPRRRTNLADLAIILVVGWWSIIAWTIGTYVMLSALWHAVRRL